MAYFGRREALKQTLTLLKTLQAPATLVILDHIEPDTKLGHFVLYMFFAEVILSGTESYNNMIKHLP